MSGNFPKTSDAQRTSPPRRRPDRRIRYSRDLLGDALVALIQERDFEEITVQEILDRAGVGRTTFYTHFSDKQDLFLSDVEEFFEGMTTLLSRSNASGSRIAPVEEMFSHLADVDGFYKALVASGKMNEIRELGIGSFARSIEQRLSPGLTDAPASERRATSHALAGALFAMLDWWMQQGKALSPAEMDRLFHSLAGNVSDRARRPSSEEL